MKAPITATLLFVTSIMSTYKHLFYREELDFSVNQNISSDHFNFILKHHISWYKITERELITEENAPQWARDG